MTLLTDSNNTVGFYIPSYKRYDKLHDKKLLSAGCTYIVRKSEQQLYEAEGVDVIAVEDDKINSLGKVRQWIIDNAKEDVVIQIDDDVEKLSYMFKQSTVYLTESQVIDELMRISQILIDLELGFASLSMNPDPRQHVREFLWKAITGGICWFNKKALRGRYEQSLMKVDADFMMQEILYNRICIVPDYLCLYAKHDTNKGGNNTNKDYVRLVENNSYLKSKWGRYYDFDYKTNKTKILVKR